jgi:DNA-binding winged helix-turn-helix (wHTH) protein
VPGVLPETIWFCDKILLRRMSLKSQEMYEFGPYRLDATGRMLFRADRAIPLPPKQIDTLIILVRARGAVVDRETLVSQVWPETFVEEAGSRAMSRCCARRLRPATNLYRDHSKRGYRFAARARRFARNRDAAHRQRVTSISIDEEVDDEGASRPSNEPVWLSLAVGGCRNSGGLGAQPLCMSGEAIRARCTVCAIRSSIAVLPFRHLNPDEGDRPMSVGLADVLITRFANLASVVVTPTTTVLPFAGRDACRSKDGRERARRHDSTRAGSRAWRSVVARRLRSAAVGRQF